MNPVLAATLRRHWPFVGAAGLFAIFMFVHQVFFEPAAKRYEVAVKKASELGLALDPTDAPAMMPPAYLRSLPTTPCRPPRHRISATRAC